MRIIFAKLPVNSGFGLGPFIFPCDPFIFPESGEGIRILPGVSYPYDCGYVGDVGDADI
jgi:hypothetical protein